MNGTVNHYRPSLFKLLAIRFDFFSSTCCKTARVNECLLVLKDYHDGLFKLAPRVLVLEA
jgi:hypothetical protein